MKRLTARWVRKAEADIVGARILDRSKPLLNDLICFHCQQSAEKYLKALLQEWVLVPPRAHELVVLLNLLLPRDATLRTLRRCLNSLNRYAVQVRYPEKNAPRRESRNALLHAERTRMEIRTRLGLPP
jgi:HEPN domain-containing protein